MRASLSAARAALVRVGAANPEVAALAVSSVTVKYYTTLALEAITL